MSSYNNFTTSVSSGFVRSTDFVCRKSLVGLSGEAVEHAYTFWDFGDGHVEYNVDVATHIYKYPGTYTITFRADGYDGSTSSTSKQVVVDYFYRDSVMFDQLPSEYADPGAKTAEPFVVSVTSANIDTPLRLIAYAAGSKSVPYQFVPDKWGFLTPRWRFVDPVTETPIESILVDTTPLYHNGKVVAVSGSASFYFIDDLSTGNDPSTVCPLLLSVTLSTERFSQPAETPIYDLPSYANSEVARAVVAWQINQTVPTQLKITENYINDVYPTKWTGVPISVLVTCENNRTDIVADVESRDTSTVLSYPLTNALGSLSSVYIGLSGVSSDKYEVDGGPFYFQNTDRTGNVISGYILTTITPLSPIDTCVVVASAVVFNQSPGSPGSLEFSFPEGYTPAPFAYISHPLQGVINKITLVPYPSSCATIAYYQAEGLLIDGYTIPVSVPVVEASTTSPENYSMYGFSGIYGIAVDPLRRYVYAADGDLGQIYKFDTDVALLCSVSHKDLNGETSVPSCVALDGDQNIWVSDRGSSTLVKYDSSLNFVLSTAPSPVGGSVLSTYLSADPILASTFVETDESNSVWATFSHPLCSFVAKFNSSGVEQVVVSMPEFSTPTGIAVRADGNVWVANSFSVTPLSGNVKMLSPLGVQLTSVDVTKPLFIASDRSSNLWVAHGYRHITKVHASTFETTTWLFDSQGVAVSATAVTNLNSNEEECWSGLSVDVHNRVWATDRTTNTVLVFPTETPTTAKRVKLKPNSTKTFIVTPESPDVTTTVTDVSAEYPSIQAIGDWTGNRWLQKYVSPLVTYSVSGVSVPFTVLDINEGPSIRLKNDGFDMANYLKQLALPEILHNNTALFEEFLVAVAGDGNSDFSFEDGGRIIYERIANFVGNHADLDTCCADQLFSLVSMLNISAEVYVDDFPADIKKAIDMFSVDRKRLRGDRVSSYEFAESKGDLLNFATTVISAGEQIVSKSLRYGTYSIVTVVDLSGNSVYPLSTIDVVGFDTPIGENYSFYQFVPEYTTEYTNNLIDWDSANTTVSYTASSVDDWYGDGGIVEQTFNHILTKTLFGN